MPLRTMISRSGFVLSTSYLACSIPPALTRDPFGVLHTRFLTASLFDQPSPVSYFDCLERNHQTTKPPSTPSSETWLRILLPAPNDSRLLSHGCGTAALAYEEMVPSHLWFHLRACLPEVCAHGPTSFPLRDLTCRGAIRRASYSSLFTIHGNVLCLCMRVSSSLSSSCIAVASESVAGDSCFFNGCTGRLWIRTQWISVQWFCPRAWQPTHTSMFLQLDRIRVRLTCCVVLSTQTWPHRLASSKPTASLRCFTNAHSGKTHVTFTVLDLQLATVSRTKNVTCPHSHALDHTGAVTSCTVTTVVSFCAV